VGANVGLVLGDPVGSFVGLLVGVGVGNLVGGRQWIPSAMPSLSSPSFSEAALEWMEPVDWTLRRLGGDRSSRRFWRMDFAVASRSSSSAVVMVLVLEVMVSCDACGCSAASVS